MDCFDFVHRDGRVVAADRPAAQGGRRHMHLDHLGTPRLLTDPAGMAISRHDYLPFGIELTSNHQERDRGNTRENKLRFTGHERDFVGGTASDNVDKSQISRAGAVLANVYAATGNANFAMAIANRMLKNQFCPSNGGSCSQYPVFQYTKPSV